MSQDKVTKVKFLKDMRLRQYTDGNNFVYREVQKGEILYGDLCKSEVCRKKFIDLELENGDMIYALRFTDIEISEWKSEALKKKERLSTFNKLPMQKFVTKGLINRRGTNNYNIVLSERVYDGDLNTAKIIHEFATQSWCNLVVCTYEVVKDAKNKTRYKRVFPNG